MLLSLAHPQQLRIEGIPVVTLKKVPLSSTHPPQKLFVRLPFTASTAVMMAINAMIPNAMMTTVMAVRNRLLLMVL